jgi:hypothetical protein
VAGCCEHGNETSGSIKCGEFVFSRVASLLKDCAPGIRLSIHSDDIFQLGLINLNAMCTIGYVTIFCITGRFQDEHTDVTSALCVHFVSYM